MDFQMNENGIFTLQFADDQVIITQDKEDLEYMTRKIKEEYKRWWLIVSINISKIKYLCIGGLETNMKLENKEEITACSVHKYLGVH